MSDKLKLGDIAIIQGTDHHPQYIGKECTIIGELKYRKVRVFGRTFMMKCYRIAIDGRELTAPPNILTRRPPTARGDLDRVVPWSACSWRPSEMRP